jgi:hypothetical protein
MASENSEPAKPNSSEKINRFLISRPPVAFSILSAPISCRTMFSTNMMARLVIRNRAMRFMVVVALKIPRTAATGEVWGYGPAIQG